MRLIIILLALYGCGKDASNKNADSLVPNNSILVNSIEMVTVECGHVPVCSKEAMANSDACNLNCEKFTNSSEKHTCRDECQSLETKSFLKMVTVDKRFTDTEIIKHCWQEGTNTVCPDSAP